MLRLASHAGTKEIVAAVHMSRAYPYDPKLAQRRWEELQHLAKDVIRIHRACEVELTEESVERVMTRPDRFTIGGSRYLLTELPEDAAPKQMEALLQRLLERGLRPVLTHPEQHAELWRHMGRLEDWVRAGALLQLGAGSLMGAFGSRTQESAWRMLKQGLAHLIASGGHDLKGRPPRLDAVRLALVGAFPVEFEHQLLAEHPQAVLQGEDLAPGPLRAPFLKTRWYQFWR